MLATLRVQRRPDPVTVVTVPAADGPVAPAPGIEATIVEAEGTTVVVAIDEAERRGWDVGFRAAWLTIEVHSALEAVGLTAAMSAALGAENIPCNVLAGFYHDHILVPLERADDAITALESLTHPNIAT